jgi:D-alanyl-D-alanine carboxypeptidase (penicillin-binding protein 5/6)
VKLGHSAAVTAVPAEKVRLLVEKGKKQQVQTQITLDASATAPVSQGQRLGTMTVKLGEQILAQVPMVAGAAVSRLSWWDVFTGLLRRTAMGGTEVK